MRNEHQLFIGHELRLKHSSQDYRDWLDDQLGEIDDLGTMPLSDWRDVAHMLSSI